MERYFFKNNWTDWFSLIRLICCVIPTNWFYPINSPISIALHNMVKWKKKLLQLLKVIKIYIVRYEFNRAEERAEKLALDFIIWAKARTNIHMYTYVCLCSLYIHYTITHTRIHMRLSWMESIVCLDGCCFNENRKFFQLNPKKFSDCL